MDIDSPNPNLPKRLSGLFPSVVPTTTTTKAQDPRLANTARQPVDLQSPNTQQAHPILPAKPASVTRPPTNPPPQVPPLSIPNSALVPRSTESQSAPNQQGASFISDLVNSLIKVTKAEEEKERVQKEIASINKNLQRAKQSQQYPSVIALFQQQLDVAKNEYANHAKSIAQHRSLSKQAQDNFDSTLSQSKLHSQLENIPGRVESLESTIKEMGQRPEPTTGGGKGNLEIGSVQKDLRGQDIIELKQNLREVQLAINNPNGLVEALDYIKKIGNSVGHQSKKIGQFTTQISQLEGEVKDVDKKLEDRVAIIKKMVDIIEEELKISNEQLGTNISDASSKLKTSNEEIQVKLGQIESNLRSLNTKRHDLSNRASTEVSQIEADLEAQRKHATEQITAQENLVASLRTQQQSLGNGGQLSEGAATTNNGVLTRVASLEKKVRSHADLLNNIKKLHQEVDIMRLSELDDLRQNQQSTQTTLETKHNETLQKVDDLATKFEETTKNQTAITTEFHQLWTSLPGTLEGFQNHVKKELDVFGNRLAPFPALSQAVTKCEARLVSHVTAIRSLEQRYSNITTGDLVDRMACAMQKMYPSVDQLSRQLTAHRTEIEARISALKIDADAFKSDTEMFKADMNQFKADTNEFKVDTSHFKLDMDQFKTDINQFRADMNQIKADTAQAQSDAQNAQASAESSQAAQVSQEQLQTLTQLPTLVQQVKDLSDKLVPIENLLHEHSIELQKNLELRSELQNRIITQDDTIGGIAQQADERVEQLENLTKYTERIDPLSKEVNFQISQIQEIRLKVDELTQAVESSTTASTNLDDLQRQLRALEDQRPPVSLEQFNDLTEKVKMYIKRLRKAEDTFKILGKEVMSSDAKETTDCDNFDKPIEQRIAGQELPQSQTNRGFVTPRPPATTKTVPTGPALGAYQPVQYNVKGHSENPTGSASGSKHSAIQARQPSQTPSGPSSSHPALYAGKSAEPRQIQNLKGKRRATSVLDSDEERNTTESSPAVESSPASSSGFSQSSSRKEKKKAKKRAEQAEEKSNTLKRLAKKRKRSKQDE